MSNAWFFTKDLRYLKPNCATIDSDFSINFKSIIDKALKAFESNVSLPLSRETEKAYESLFRYGPFPEPFLKQNERFCRKWHQNYIGLIVREDLKDTSRVVELDKVENLLFLMPSRVASPLSISSTLKDRMKWLHPYITLGLQVVDKRGVLKKYANNTWIISVEKLLHLLP